MNKKEILDSLKSLVPYKKYENQGEEANHIKDVIGPSKIFNDRSICSLLSAIHEITDDPDIKELALEAIWMSERMHKRIRLLKGREDIWLEILDPSHPENDKK
tara:strand:+ start:385 stop:693 length:309 start_codon:yes stop_codon:yes gene_type:complete